MAKVVKLVGGRKLQIKHGGGGGVFAGIGHKRLHSATSASDHSAATGADKGKYLHNDSGTGVVDWQAAPAPPTLYDSFGVVIDGGTAVPTTGSKGFRVVPYACTITGWEILADAPGDAVVDVKKSTYAVFPTTATIAGAEKPTLSTAQKNQDLTLTTWTVALAAGDILEFNLDSVATCKRVTVTLFVTRT